MNLKYKLLSYPIDSKIPVYGSSPRPDIKPHQQIARGDACNTYFVSVHNHSGTHADAPSHFISGGRCILDYSPEELIFNAPIILDLPKALDEWIEEADIKHARHVLSDADCILFRTGFGKYRGKENYKTHNPGIEPEAILYLRKNFPGIRCAGIDALSVSGFQDRAKGRKAHFAAFERRPDLGEPLLLIEDMNLNAVLPNEVLKRIFVVPWQISAIDSAPCTVIAEVLSDE